jgi:hypothetical protein
MIRKPNNSNCHPDLSFAMKMAILGVYQAKNALFFSCFCVFFQDSDFSGFGRKVVLKLFI